MIELDSLLSDPNWLFSTMAQSAAALVAIMGGFLVSRFAAVSSQRQGIESQLREVTNQLSKRRKDLHETSGIRRQITQKWFIKRAVDEAAQSLGKADREGLAEKYSIRGTTPSEMLSLADDLNDMVQQEVNHLDTLTKTQIHHFRTDPVLKKELRRKSQYTHEEDLVHFAVLGVLDPDGEPRPEIPGDRALLRSERRRYEMLIDEEDRLEREVHSLQRDAFFLEREIYRAVNPRPLFYGLYVLCYMALVGVAAPVVVLIGEAPHESFERTPYVVMFVLGVVLLCAFFFWAYWDSRRPRSW